MQQSGKHRILNRSNSKLWFDLFCCTVPAAVFALERLMLKHRYEGIEEHKAEHQELINSARELQQKILQADGPVVDEHIESLERWLTVHILTTDLRLGSHLSQVM